LTYRAKGIKWHEENLEGEGGIYIRRQRVAATKKDEEVDHPDTLFTLLKEI